MKAHLPALDGLRCFAVSFVLLAHAGAPYPKQGGTGVDIFFVLSGFLITGILAREHRATGTIRLGRFYLRRALRLFPALILAVWLFVGINAAIGAPINLAACLITLTYTGNYFLALTPVDLSCLGPCWSLACEEQFYLLWPFAILALEWAVESPRTKGMILALLGVALAVYRQGLADHVTTQRLYYALDTHADGLVFGAALSYLIADVKGWRFVRWLVPIAFAGIFALTARYGLFSPFMGRWGFFLTAVAAVVILADLVNRNSIVRDLFEWPPFVYLGRISYGLYLLHSLVYHAVDALAPACRNCIPLKLALAVALAALSFRIIESPILNLKNRIK